MARIFLLILILLSFQNKILGQSKKADPELKEIEFRSPSEYTGYFVANDSLEFIQLEYGQFRLVYKDESYTAEHLNEIKTHLDTALHRIFEVLDIQSYPYGIYLVAVDSEEDMEALMGYHIKGGAALGHDLVFFVFNAEIRPQFKHEILHLIAYEVWGQHSSRLLDEGLATYSDNFCFYTEPFRTINAHFLDQGILFPIDSLIDAFNESAAQNDVIAYLESAGIVKFLIDHYGLERFKKLWVEGFQAFHKIYGFSAQSLEEQWHQHLREVKRIPIDLELLMEKGCG